MTSINSSTNPLLAAAYQTSSETKAKSPLDVAANLLQISKSDLTTELKSGKSLSDVAKQQGISPDYLTSALAANDPSTGSKADKLARATEIANKVGMPTRPAPPQRPVEKPATVDTTDTAGSTSSGKTLLDELSSLLNTDTATLTDQLKNGTSLSEILTSNGVSMSSLASTVQQGLIYDNLL